jgi:hypothetical protein
MNAQNKGRLVGAAAAAIAIVSASSGPYNEHRSERYAAVTFAAFVVSAVAAEGRLGVADPALAPVLALAASLSSHRNDIDPFAAHAVFEGLPIAADAVLIVNSTLSP